MYIVSVHICDYFLKINLEKYSYWVKALYEYFQVAIWKVCIYYLLFNSVSIMSVL